MYRPEDIEPWGSFCDTLEHKPYIQLQQLYSWEIENRTWEEWAPTVAHYFATISQVDDAVGRILSALDESGQRDNTLVVFTADHGDTCGGHRMIDKHYIMYEDIVHVPFILSGPGVSAHRDDSFVYNSLDLVPTLLEYAGCPARDDVQGASLMPLARGERPEWRQEVISAYNGQQMGLFCQRMIREAKWKYVWAPTDIDELYDLENDPHELNNLYGEPGHEELLARLRRKLYDTLLADGDGMMNGPWIKTQLVGNRKV